MKSVGLGQTVLIVIGVFVGIGALAAVVKQAGDVIDPAAAVKEKTDEDAEEARFQLALGGALKIKQAMRNPDSFKLSEVFVSKDGRSVCYEYRSQNGFGGMNTSNLVMAEDGSAEPGDPRFKELWAKHCTASSGVVGVDLTDNVMAGLREYDKLHSY